MAFASGVYGATLRDSMKNVIALDYTAATHKVALYTSTFTPNFDASPASYSTTNEVSGTGYTAGGSLLVSPTLVAASGLLTFDAADQAWTSSTLTAHGTNIYADGLAPKALIVAVDFGADYSTVAGTFTIQWNAAGIFTVDYIP